MIKLYKTCPRQFRAETAYRVVDLNKQRALGYAYKRQCSSYMGTQGWNRGIRITDYNPKRWYYTTIHGKETESNSRKEAVNSLINIFKRKR